MLRLFKIINNFSLYILVFTVVFENWDPFGFGGTQSITYLTTIIYVFSWIPLLKYNLRIKSLQKFFIPLLLFIFVGIISTALNSVYATNLEDLLKTRFYQLIILALLVSNHIFIEKDIIWKVLTVYVCSVFFMYILALMGIGVTYELGRINIFGENPNGIGTKAVVAFMIVLGYLFNSKQTILTLILSILGLIGFLSLIILTASRGALLSLFVGTLIMTLLINIRPIKKVVLISVGIAFILLFYQYVLDTNEVFRRRITNAVESGDIGRNELWSTALLVIEDNLFIGVGIPTSAFLTEMYKYGGGFMDAHNIFLYVLMTTGVTGFFFFMLFLFRLSRDLIKSCMISKNAMFLTIFLIIILFWSKAGAAIGSIYSWFFIAILIGSTLIDIDYNKITKKPNAQ